MNIDAILFVLGELGKARWELEITEIHKARTFKREISQEKVREASQNILFMSAVLDKLCSTNSLIVDSSVSQAFGEEGARKLRELLEQKPEEGVLTR